MPRLSPKQYLKQRRFPRQLWLQRISAYSYLTPTQQWQIHAFFRPSDALTDVQLLKHRKAITAEQPSLPHQAGKTIKDFGQILRGKAKVHATVKTTTTGRSKTAKTIRVRSLVRPQIDIPRLARALIELEHQKSGTTSRKP